MEGVNRAPLADAIHAADALLEAHRIPWQLEIDDHAAARGAGSALRRGVGGEQNGSGSLENVVERAPRVRRAVRPPCRTTHGRSSRDCT